MFRELFMENSSDDLKQRWINAWQSPGAGQVMDEIYAALRNGAPIDACLRRLPPSFRCRIA
jgi:hypothetical protein